MSQVFVCLNVNGIWFLPPAVEQRQILIPLPLIIDAFNTVRICLLRVIDDTGSYASAPLSPCVVCCDCALSAVAVHHPHNLDVLDACLDHDVNSCDTDVSLSHKLWLPH